MNDAISRIIPAKYGTKSIGIAVNGWIKDSLIYATDVNRFPIPRSYRCGNGCRRCSFPNMCTECEFGYYAVPLNDGFYCAERNFKGPIMIIITIATAQIGHSY